jgi:hypothetical protein
VYDLSDLLAVAGLAFIAGMAAVILYGILT